MSELRRIQIVGGGLAGLTLGIALRQRGIPATITEAGHYPRHKVCGEFISGRGLEVLDGLGVKEKLLRAGAMEARNAAFFVQHRTTSSRALPVPALCISRFVLDDLLAGEFQSLGGDLRIGKRWQNGCGEGVVRATGRRLHSTENGLRWFGLKAHAKNVLLKADLEMHVGENGYVGLCKLPGGEVNVCGLFRRNGKSGESPGGFELLRGKTDTELHERLAGGEFDKASLCSVAGISLEPKHAADETECRIGDALTMIPPFTGNGMSLAFESAELAAGPLADFSHGTLTWDRARETIARSCDEKFSRRLGWAKWLQRAMFSSQIGSFLLFISRHNERAWRLMFDNTR